ncbi:bifunctional diguanylate cyclase/phosphodiesterase [Ideonella sp. B508-1]|uniref:putative bifunctional diguanylate cyclase/phosphodiesterase n=1 Tax=Ideonella sp. B508-1 TaxID=137716 RepID=UPI000347D214|nr:phosphodiesterase [Ideonella sp. B508-1]
MIPQNRQEEGGSWLAAGGPEGTRSHRAFLHLFWVSSFALILLLEGYSLWVGGNPMSRLLFNAVFLVCALGALALLQRGQIQRVTLLTATLPPALLMLVIFTARSIYIPAVAALPPMVVATAWLLGRRAAVWITAAAVLEVMGLGLYLHLGGQPRLPPPEPLQYAITLLVFLLSSLSIGLLSESSHREQIRIAQEHAFVDGLTGLANRRLFMERLGQSRQDSQNPSRHGALLLIDVDQFHHFGAAFGARLGNSLLMTVAERLRLLVGPDMTLARLEGDVFGVLVTGRPQAGELLLEVTRLAEQISRAMAQPIHLEGKPQSHTATVGISTFDGPGSAGDLLHQAEQAVAQGKALGRGRVHFFDPDRAEIAQQRARLEADLRLALQQGQLLLHYQPQVRDDRPIGAEALVRWQHPERGLIPPGEFIPVAEACGLIVPLGQWVLEQACAVLAQWRRDPLLAPLTLSANVSAHQIQQPDFVPHLTRLIERSGCNPQRLKLELTESTFIGDEQTAIRAMTALRALGIRFSLDDFGTGYSSLGHLKKLPLDQIKIDQSFVRDLLDDPDDAAITQAITQLARNFGMEVMAEGVELPAQRSALESLGCHAFQGDLFARPKPLPAFEDFCRRHLAAAAGARRA